MYCIKSSQLCEEMIKKSRFIAIISPCHSETEVSRQLQQWQHQHPNASHIVFAYRIKTDKGIISRFNDAGEPSGTAGKPVYQHIEGKQLINTLIVVIRYFGGIKLGAGGLTRAYSHSAKLAIESATINEYIEYEQLKLNLDYKQLQAFQYHLKKLGGTIIEQHFTEKIDLIVKVPADNVEAVLDLV